MTKGTIQELRSTYGFIRPADGGRHVFFHQTALRGVRFNDLRKGMEVTYDAIVESRGPKATAVRCTARETGEGYRFLNPYNFIRSLDQPRPVNYVLGDCPPPPHDRYVGLTGQITCEVENVTPLFVSDSHAIEIKTVKVKDPYNADREIVKEHPIYRFFEYEGQPALPASSLRGMIRSVFEAATNSCFGVFGGKRMSYRLDARKAGSLVPARVEREETGAWTLRLLSGFVPLSPGQRPKGAYAASVNRYDPIRGKRTSKAKIELKGLRHGDACCAIIENKGIFSEVIEIAKTRRGLSHPVKPSQYIVEGWLCVNNQNIENKRKERFFFRFPANRVGPTRIALDKPVCEAYEDLIADYQDRHQDAIDKREDKGQALDEVLGKGRNAIPALSRYMYHDEDLKLGEGTLVYTELEDAPEGIRVNFIAPAAVPRVAYDHTIAELLLQEHLHTCTQYTELCPTCRTFGWVHPNPPKDQPSTLTAYAGRVRFSHAYLSEDRGAFDDITLAILSSPKPTTTRFYLRPARGKPRNGLEDDEAGYDGNNVLRGRKFYRHNGEAQPQEYERATVPGYAGKDDQNRTVRGARKPGNKFRFTINFENLMPVELGALLWTIELREGSQQFHHRLGYAKPLGFGSVRVNVVGLEIIDMAARYVSLEEDGQQDVLSRLGYWVDIYRESMSILYKQSFVDLPNIKDLLILAGDPPELPIHYPRTEVKPSVEGKNFEWFVGNKRSGRSAGPRLALPLAEDDTEGFPLLDKYGREQR